MIKRTSIRVGGINKSERKDRESGKRKNGEGGGRERERGRRGRGKGVVKEEPGEEEI